MAKIKSSTFQFEKAMTTLQSIVNDMEKGQLSLEDSLSAFGKGIALIQQCQQQLKDAEQKIQVLTQGGKLIDWQENNNSEKIE